MTNFQATDADIGADIINTRTMWPTLSGRLHAAIRILWIAWAIVALTVFVASLPAYLGGVALIQPIPKRPVSLQLVRQPW